MSSMVVLDGVKELQVDENPKKVTQGYFRIDHEIFQDERLRQQSGEGFRIFLWMSSRAWRFPASKGFLRASISMIHLNTGVSEATISRALKELQTAGLIQLHNVDRKGGNWWWVVSVFQFPRKEGCKNDTSQNEGSVPSKRNSTSFKMRARLPQIEGHIRSIKEDINKKIEVEEIQQQRAWQEFERRYPIIGDRENILGSIISKEFPGLFKPPQQVMENLAVRKWFNELYKKNVDDGSSE